MYSYAYAAGLLDGEGSLGVYSRGADRGWTSHVSIASQSLEVLRWLQVRWQGNIQAHQTGGTYRVNKWILQSKSAQVNFLEDVLPHLIIKRGIAEHVLLFLTDRYAMTGEEFAAQTKVLNKSLSLNFQPYSKAGS